MGRIGAKLGQAKAAAAKAGDAVKARAGAVKDAEGPSPNPMTNIIITDIVLRGGGRLLRNTVEKGLLGVKYAPEKASSLVKGRGMASTLIATAVARIATRSVPGALLVGGGLLAKTLYDRRKGHAAREEGKAQVEKRVQAEPKI
jgi:hypothetical protein